MILDLSRGCDGDHIRPSDYSVTGDLNINASDENKKAYLRFIKEGYDNLTYSQFMFQIFNNVSGVLWPIVGILGTISFLYQKRNIDKFEDENPEYFV